MAFQSDRVASGVPEAWVKLPDPAQMGQLAQASPYFFGFVPAMGRLLASHPEIGQHFMGLFAEIMFSPDRSLSRREREMVAAVAAAAQDCFY